jgi:hypothetical protein
MAIALVQSKTGTSALATTTASFNTTPTNGNLIVLAFAADDYNGTANAGWTESTGMNQEAGLFHGGYLWWKVASGGSNSFQYTIGSATGSTWLLMEFSGVAASPYDVSAGTSLNASNTTITSSAITPTSGNRLLICANGFSAGGNDLTGSTYSYDNSFTLVDTIGRPSPATDIAAAYRLVTANGSTSYSTTITLTAGNSPQSASAMAIAFKEAAAGSTYTLTAAQGSYTLSGQNVSLKSGNVVSAAQGSYSLTGQALNLNYSGGGGATPALVQSNEGAGALATTTVSFATTPINGNLIVLAFAADAYNGTPDSGWTQATGMEQQSFHGGYLWYRIAAGNANSFTYTIGSAVNSAWVLMEFSGIDSSTPLDLSSGQLQQASSSHYSTPAITPTNGSRLIVAALCAAGQDVDYSLSDVQNWTNSFTNIRASANSGIAPSSEFVGTSYKVVTADGVATQQTEGDIPGSAQSQSGLIISFRGSNNPSGTSTITAAQGTYTYTGVTLTQVLAARSLTAAQGSYALTGQDAAFINGKGVQADFGTYTLTGNDQGLIYSGDNNPLGGIFEAVDYQVLVTDNLFQLDAPPAIAPGNAVIADQGVYTLAGQDANFLYTAKILTADVGTYSLSGQDAGMIYSALTNRNLTADRGIYTLTGVPLALIFNGAVDLSTQTVLSDHKPNRSSASPRGKNLSRRRFDEIMAQLADEKDAETAKQAQAAQKAAEAPKAVQAAPAQPQKPTDEIDDMTAEKLIAALKTSMKSEVQNAIASEMDDINAALSLLIQKTLGGDAGPQAPQPNQPAQPFVPGAPWKP